MPKRKHTNNALISAQSKGLSETEPEQINDKMLSGQPAVSVVIPCYNVERFVGQCVESVLAQTLRDLQIICVNDGSIDGTLDILKTFAAEDNRVMVIDIRH